MSDWGDEPAMMLLFAFVVGYLVMGMFDGRGL